MARAGRSTSRPSEEGQGAVSSFFFFFVFPPAPSPAPTPPPSHFWRGGCGLCILNYLVRVEVPVYVCVRQRDPLCKDVPRLALPFEKERRTCTPGREKDRLSVRLTLHQLFLPPVLSSRPQRGKLARRAQHRGERGPRATEEGNHTQPTIANTHAPLPLSPPRPRSHPALPPLSCGGPSSPSPCTTPRTPWWPRWAAGRRRRRQTSSVASERRREKKGSVRKTRAWGGGGLGFGERRGHSASWPPRTPTPPSEAGLLPRAPHARTGQGNQESDGSAPSHPNPLPLIFFSLSLPTLPSLSPRKTCGPAWRARPSTARP